MNHTVIILQGVDIQAYMIGQFIGAVIGVGILVWLWKKDNKELAKKRKELAKKRKELESKIKF
jgi:glycerol uptake facilitator-like aquaporin